MEYELSDSSTKHEGNKHVSEIMNHLREYLNNREWIISRNMETKSNIIMVSKGNEGVIFWKMKEKKILLIH